MKRLALSITTCLALIFPAAVSANASEVDTQIFYSSKALDPTTGELIYTEKHHYVKTPTGLKSATVKYFDADATLVAQKEIDFTTSPESPFFVRENTQTGYREGYEAVSKTRPYQGRLFQQQQGETAACDNVIALRPGMIVDAGFNVHLQNNMAALAAGQPLIFELLIPKACRALEFEARGETTDKGLLISLKPTSFLARLVVPNTQVLYNPDTTTLLEYHGLSDLTDAQGRSMKVSIYFDKPVVKQVASANTAAEAGAIGVAERGNNGVYGKQTDSNQAFNNGRQ
ncbi:MAG: hypothetical protein ACPG06_01725 [Alphaproteobacteria bacterium]